MPQIEVTFVAYEVITVEVSEEELEAIQSGNSVDEVGDRAYNKILDYGMPDWEIDESNGEWFEVV